MSGGFTNPLYDNCNLQQRDRTSAGPYDYMMYSGYAVNCNKCQPMQSQRAKFVDVESEIWGGGRMRLGSKCATFKYQPDCKFVPGQPNVCLSTFSPLVPINPEPRVCPVPEAYLYFNSGLLRPGVIGPKFPSTKIC